MAYILVIEDDEVMRSWMRRVLEQWDHDVREAVNGAEGVTFYKERPADLVITDMFMPVKDGLNTIRELLEGYPDTRIIAITSQTGVKQFDFLEVAKALGAKGALNKPFGMEEFQEAVEAALAS